MSYLFNMSSTLRTYLICNQQFTPSKDISEVEFPWTASLPPVTSSHCFLVNLKVILYISFITLHFYSDQVIGYLSCSYIGMSKVQTKRVTYLLVKINHISENIRRDCRIQCLADENEVRSRQRFDVHL